MDGRQDTWGRDRGYRARNFDGTRLGSKVLLQGENADGATVDERVFIGSIADDSPTASAADRVLAAILAIRNDPPSRIAGRREQ